jgi:hypothetical protein
LFYFVVGFSFFGEVIFEKLRRFFLGSGPELVVSIHVLLYRVPPRTTPAAENSFTM